MFLLFLSGSVPGIAKGLLAPCPSAGLKEPCTLRKKFNFLRSFFCRHLPLPNL